MALETPLQYDLFTGEKVDNRTATQRKADAQRDQLQQIEMFKQREIAQFGVRAHPQMSLSPHTKLVLVREDPRTEEEIERDRMKEAEDNTHPMFVIPHPSPPEKTLRPSPPPLPPQPVLTLKPADLITCRPDLAKQIERLDQSGFDEIIEILHHLLQPDLWLTLRFALDWYFFSQTTNLHTRQIQ